MKIKGFCFYFQHKHLNWQEAQDECHKKFDSAPGRLFEPRISSMNEAVWKAADEKWGGSSFGEFWLGMNDLKDGTYRYMSNGDEVVEGMWKNGEPDGQVHGYQNAHCVGYYERHTPAQWYDLDCNDLRQSICVSIVEGDTEGETGDYFSFMLLPSF